MKIIVKPICEIGLKEVPDGDLFSIGGELYFKSSGFSYNVVSEQTTIKCYSVRTGGLENLSDKTLVRKVKSITVEYEE